MAEAGQVCPGAGDASEHGDLTGVPSCAPPGAACTPSLWFRGIIRVDLQPGRMAEAFTGFHAHALTAFLLFALWPFTRLVHVFSAPVGTWR